MQECVQSDAVCARSRRQKIGRLCSRLHSSAPIRDPRAIASVSSRSFGHSTLYCLMAITN
eukprot:6176358-Pleurochrysis_carterae.AAC.1